MKYFFVALVKCWNWHPHLNLFNHLLTINNAKNHYRKTENGHIPGTAKINLLDICNSDTSDLFQISMELFKNYLTHTIAIEVAKTTPTSGSGIAESTAPNLVNIPKIIIIKPPKIIVDRLKYSSILLNWQKSCLATRVIPITPTFSACVVIPIPGPIKPEMKQPRPKDISFERILPRVF